MIFNNTLKITLLIIFAGLSVPFAVAEPGDLLLTINNPDPDENDIFGWSLATTLDGNLLVSNVYDDTGAFNAGTVYLYDGVSGELLQTIHNPEPTEQAQFGRAMLTTPDGNLLISNIFDSEIEQYAGSVYLLDGTTFEVILKIHNPTVEGENHPEYFANSIAVTPNGDYIIGSYGQDLDGFSSAGVLYVFDKTTGELKSTIENPSPGFSDYFGAHAIADHNGNLLISSVRDSNNTETYSGSVYLFDGISGEIIFQAFHPEKEFNVQFGASPELTPDGNFLITARFDDTGAENTGAVFLINGTNGELLQRIYNPEPGDTDLFGHTTDVTSDGNFLIGSMHDDTGASNAGSVYLFDGITGELLLTLRNPTPEPGDNFGLAVATTPDDNLLISAYRDDTVSVNAGAVYLFEGFSTAQEIEIDIKKKIDCKKTKGNIKVKLFGLEDFDVSTVDISSLELNGISITEVHDKLHDKKKKADLHLDKEVFCLATQDVPLKESVHVTLSGSNADGKFEGITDIIIKKR